MSDLGMGIARLFPPVPIAAKLGDMPGAGTLLARLLVPGTPSILRGRDRKSRPGCNSSHRPTPGSTKGGGGVAARMLGAAATATAAGAGDSEATRGRPR